MKNKLLSLTCIVTAAWISSGCHVRIPGENTPKPSYYGVMDRTTVSNGFPNQSEPWVVISDRASNTVFMDKGSEKSPKEIKFLEPLLVMQYNNSKKLVKVAEYNPDALMQKIPVRNVKTYGWIPEDQLLLWTNSIKSSETGFSMKAALAPNNSDVLNNGAKYLKNDSVVLFSTPDLTKVTGKKLPIGQMVYIYKKGENDRYLIGKYPSVKIDSVEGNIYGWVNGNIVTPWGERTALRSSADYAFTEDVNQMAITKISAGGATEQTRFVVTDSELRTPMENLIAVKPTALDSQNTGKFFTNALDYNNNFILNVLGEPLYYDRFKEITRKNKNLNIVFAIDISRNNTQNISIAKSAFQDIVLKLHQLNYFHKVKFGAVLYKANSCGDNVAASALNANYEVITKFIDEQSVLMNCNSSGGQPLAEGLDAAGELLNPVRDETNILLVTGSTSLSGSGAYNAIRSLTSARARTLFFQTASASADSYNNFVLMAENVLTNTAKNIAELDKERIVDQALIFDKNNYNLVQGEAGVYSLDYPKGSMSQGFVIYPKKGEATSVSLLSKSFDTMVGQLTHYNKTIDSTLTAYFKSSVGSSKTFLKPDFTQQYPSAPALIPTELASQLVPYDFPFLARGTFPEAYREYWPQIQKGILISEPEYDALRNFYMETYQQTEPYSASFSQRKAVSRYLKVLKKYSVTDKFRKGAYLEKPMDYSVALATGFDNSSEEMLSRYMLKGWKKSKVIPENAAKTYFNQFKILADRLLDHKNNPKIMIEQNGARFYWLNSYFMPMVTPLENLP